MADEHGDYLYSQWMQRKASAMRRPVLSCGCRNDGRSTYVRGTCDCIVCSEHRDDEHEHEPEEQVEAPRPVDLSLGARHHLTGGVYEVTAADGRNATLTPVEAREGAQRLAEACDLPMTEWQLDVVTQMLTAPRRPWWKPNTWRRG